MSSFQNRSWNQDVLSLLMGKILHQLRRLMSQVSKGFLPSIVKEIQTIFYVCCHMPSVRGLLWILLKVVFHSQKYWRYPRPNLWLIPNLENLRSAASTIACCVSPLCETGHVRIFELNRRSLGNKYFNGIDSGTWMGLYSHHGDI